MNKTELFIERARAIYGKKYDYRLVHYKSSSVAVNIVCPKHGAFQKSPSNHIHKSKPQGCSTCCKENKYRLFIQELLNDFKEAHGDRYDYSQLAFDNSKKPVNIICKTHGSFSLRIDAHKNGVGCRECKTEASKNELLKGYLLRFQSVYGDKYDYSDTVYVAYQERISVRCNKHGEFKILIASHLKGSGCPKCRGWLGVERQDNEQFIAQAIAKHGKTYDYSKVKFTNLGSNVSIICHSHGEFTQNAAQHLKGSGCPACVYEKRSGSKFTSQEIIERLKEVHGEIYNFKNVEVTLGSKQKVSVTCYKHGEFSSRVDSLLRGSGCKACALEAYSEKLRLDQEIVIKRMQVVHSNFYSYEKTEYTLAKDKVVVTCPIHGDFEIESMKHMRGNGCRMCGNLKKTGNKEDFIREAQKHHGKRYDYSEVEYETAHVSVKIKCSDHGVFVQTPNNHKRGQGCPYCGEFERHLENKDPSTPTTVYYMTLKYEQLIFYKVGITTTSVAQRFRTLPLDNVEIVEQQEVRTGLRNALEVEQYILSDFQEYCLPMDSVLKVTKGGSECFCDDVLGLNDLSLSDYLVT